MNTLHLQPNSTLVPHSSRAIRRTTSFTLDYNQHSIVSEKFRKCTTLTLPASRVHGCIASAQAEPQQRESTMLEHEPSNKEEVGHHLLFACNTDSTVALQDVVNSIHTIKRIKGAVGF
jgi:hypothetical protein